MKVFKFFTPSQLPAITELQSYLHMLRMRQILIEIGDYYAQLEADRHSD